mmetsp:Transcript_111015/g.287047  ORF Transcript_111015/g.287047 Transcript_111015/m.287047 type:complete len:232 (+) Transcript_111015:2339-3034(+)
MQSSVLRKPLQQNVVNFRKPLHIGEATIVGELHDYVKVHGAVVHASLPNLPLKAPNSYLETELSHLQQSTRLHHVHAIHIAFPLDEQPRLRGDVPRVRQHAPQEEGGLCVRGAAPAKAIRDHRQVHMVGLLVRRHGDHPHALAAPQDPGLRVARQRRAEHVDDPMQQAHAERAHGLQAGLLAPAGVDLAAQRVLQKLGEDALVDEVPEAEARAGRVLYLQPLAIQADVVQR